jgi:hypothetical protein
MCKYRREAASRIHVTCPYKMQSQKRYKQQRQIIHRLLNRCQTGVSQYSDSTTGWMTRVRVPSRAQIFSLSYRIHTVSGLIKPPNKCKRGCFSPGVKRPVHEADNSPPSSVEVKNAWSYSSTPPYVMSWYLIKHKIRLRGFVLK